MAAVPPLVEAPAEVPVAPITALNWSMVYLRALKAGAGDTGDDGAALVAAMDSDDLQAVLRVRARHATRDLADIDTWVSMMVAHNSRSPYTHALMSLQKWKKESKGEGNGYLGRLPQLMNRVVFEFEQLLKDESLEDPYIWGRIFSVNDGTDPQAQLFDRKWKREEIVEVIFRTSIAGLTEFVRRFAKYGVGCEQSLLWSVLSLGGGRGSGGGDLTPEQSLETMNGIDKALADGAEDGFSEKFVRFFNDEFDAAKASETHRLEGAAGDSLTFVNKNTKGDIQHIESKNSVLRAMSTRGRRTKRALQSSRHAIKCSDPDLVTKAMVVTAVHY